MIIKFSSDEEQERFLAQKTFDPEALKFHDKIVFKQGFEEGVFAGFLVTTIFVIIYMLVT